MGRHAFSSSDSAVQVATSNTGKAMNSLGVLTSLDNTDPHSYVTYKNFLLYEKAFLIKNPKSRAALRSAFVLVNWPM